MELDAGRVFPLKGSARVGREIMRRVFGKTIST